MQRRVSWVWWAALLSGAAGCGPGAELWLGSERPLQRQLADGGSADAAADEDAAVVAAKRCEGPLGPPVAIDYQVDFSGVCTKEDMLQLDFEQLVPASDGSLWIRGWCFYAWSSPHIHESTTWLAHIDPAGNLLRTLEIPRVEWSAQKDVLALDDQGDPWLASADVADGYDVGGRLQHYDTDLEPVGEPIVFEQWMIAQMERLPGHGFAVIGRGTDSSVNFDRFTGLVDDEGTMVWTQREDRFGATPALAAAETGQIAIASSDRMYLDNGRLPSPMHVRAFSPDGELRWSTQLIPQLNGLESTPVFFDLRSDAQGNLFAGAHETGKSSPMNMSLQKLSAQGDPEWLWELEVNPVLRSHTVHPATGHVVTAGMLNADDPQFPQFFYEGTVIEITADGATCHTHPYSDIYGLMHLVYSASGELFFAGIDTVGRLRPLDP